MLLLVSPQPTAGQSLSVRLSDVRWGGRIIMMSVGRGGATVTGRMSHGPVRADQSSTCCQSGGNRLKFEKR